MKRSKGLLIAAYCFIIVNVLQAILLARYVDRLPHDWVGIGLSGAAITGFTLAATGFLIQWRRQKHVEKRELATEAK